MPFLFTSLSAEWAASGSGSMVARRPVRYAERVQKKRDRLRVLLFVAVFIILSFFIRSFVFQSWQIRDQTMSPYLVAGDVVLAVPFWSIFSSAPFSLSGPLHQGDFVLVDDRASEVTPFALLAVDAVLRFFSLQRFSILEAQYGKNFGVPEVMRIKSIELESKGDRHIVVYTLESDTRPISVAAFADTKIEASRVRAKLVFRIWPIKRIGPLK